MSAFYDFNVTLHRDSLATPWGFRLEGGKDFLAPLTIQRVFTGSPASGDLQRGDIILAIQNRDTSSLFHQEANDIIKHCGGSLQLSIRRGQSGSNTLPRMQPVSYRPASSMAFLSQPPLNRNHLNYSQTNLFFAEDPLTNYIRSRPIEKVKDPKPILSQTGSPIMPGETPVMSSRSSIKRYRPTQTLPLMAKLPTTSFSPSTSSTTATYSGINNHNSTPIPFSDKRMVSQIQSSLSKAIHSPKHLPTIASSYPVFNFANTHSHAPVQAPVHVPVPAPMPAPIFRPVEQSFSDEYRRGPAWRESLRKTGINIYEDQAEQVPVHGQSFHVCPPPVAPKPIINYHELHHQPKSPKVVNLQYNSPIGLYSRDNIKEELHKQVGNQGNEFHLMASSEF